MTATTLSPREMKRLRKQGADYVSPSPYTVKAAFQRGDLFTKLSAVVFGLGNIVRKQYVKGIAMLVLGKKWRPAFPSAIFVIGLTGVISWATGFADTRPLQPNDSEAHRAANRRVELVLETVTPAPK